MDRFKFTQKQCDKVYDLYSYMVDSGNGSEVDVDRLEELTCAAGKVVIKTLNKINKKLRRE